MCFKNICTAVLIIITKVLLLSCGLNNDTNSSKHNLNLSQTDKAFIINEAVPSFLQFFETSLSTYNTELIQLTNSTDSAFNTQDGWIKMECKGTDADLYCADFIRVYKKEVYGSDDNGKLLELSEVLKLSSLGNHDVDLAKNDTVYSISLRQSIAGNGLLRLSFVKNKYNFIYVNNEHKLIFNINSEFFRYYGFEFNCIQTQTIYNCTGLSFDDNHKEIVVFYVDESENTSVGNVNFTTQKVSLNDSDIISIPPKKYTTYSEIYTHSWVEYQYGTKFMYTVHYNKEFKPISVIRKDMDGEILKSEINYINNTSKSKILRYGTTTEFLCDIDFDYDHWFLENVLHQYCY